MKKLLAMLAALSVLSTALVGCSGDSGSSETTPAATTEAGETTAATTADPNAPKEEFTFTMLYSDNANYAYDENWMIWDIIKDATGAICDPIVVPESDWNVKVQTAFNTGEIPDIIPKTWPTGDQIDSGMLLAVSDYTNMLPTYSAFIEENNYGEWLDSQRYAGDGKYYFLPTKARTLQFQDHNWMIRTDLLEEHGLAMPETMEDIYETAKALKEIYPDSVPMTNRFQQGNLMQGVAQAWNLNAGWGYSNGMVWNELDSVWEFGPVTDRWREMVTWMNKMFSEGLLDVEWNTLDSTIYEQKVTTGQTFILYDWSGNALRYHTEARDEDPDFTITTMVAPKTEYDYAINSAAPWSSQWVLSSELPNKDYFENFMAFVDWGYTDEAALAMTFGIEGESYEMDDTTGRYVRIDPENNDWHALAGVDNNSLAIRQHTDALYTSLTDEDIAAIEMQAEVGAYDPPPPASPMTPEDNEQALFETAGLNDFVTESMMAFIEGNQEITDESWAAYVQGCKDRGSDWLQGIYDAAA